MDLFKMFLIAGSGSFIGGGCRFLLSRAMQTHFPHAFPVGTLGVNLIGCLLIGLLYGLFDRYDPVGYGWRIFLTVGFCGGFTTFSTMMNETLTLLRDGSFLYFFSYLAISVIGGLFAVYLGILLFHLR